jgi:hypothetical protein
LKLILREKREKTELNSEEIRIEPIKANPRVLFDLVRDELESNFLILQPTEKHSGRYNIIIGIRNR